MNLPGTKKLAVKMKLVTLLFEKYEQNLCLSFVEYLTFLHVNLHEKLYEAPNENIWLEMTVKYGCQI